MTTGIMVLDGMPGTWILEENKLKFKVMGMTFPFDYKFSGNTLTLIYEGGIRKFTKKE